MSGQSEDFRGVLFHSESVKRILRLVPVKVKTEFFHYCTENKVTLKWNDGSYYVEFGKFIQNEYRVALETLESSVAPEADMRNDVVEQFKRDAEGVGELREETLSENESCKSVSAREENAVSVVKDEEDHKDNDKESEGFDEKLLKDKESFAYKLRKLGAQLFEKNENGEMSSPSIERYEKMVKKFVTKFKNYKMPKSVRLLKYEVDLWENECYQY